MSENYKLTKIEKQLGLIDNLLLKRNVPASQLTTFKGGGSVKLMLVPKNLTALILAMRALECENIVPIILGKGANTIIDDGGISTPVVSLEMFGCLSADGNLLRAESGCSGAELLIFARDNGLTGLEFLAGIPATVGGLVLMNAGAFGAEIKDKLVECEVLSRGLVVKLLPKFGYRKCELDGILLSATFNLDVCSSDEIVQEIESHLELRRKKQPNEPSCGSVFKAFDGVPAAVYIEGTGLKGTKVGGAQISNKHCNFIVNTGGATASDFLQLVEMIQEAVLYQLGAKLETEFVLLKDDETTSLDL